MSETVQLEYTPRSAFVPFHQRSQRWACLVVHRRGGKTVACINELVARAAYNTKKGARYAYLAPFYRQAKDVAWQYLKEYAKPLIKKIRESELRIELVNGAWITLYGADNPDALRGIYLDGVVLDEFGDCRPSLWGTVILPTLVDRGGWAIFIGTPKGKNHFYDIYKRSQTEEGWFNLTLRASESGLIGEAELTEMKAQMEEEEYEQEMECSFDAAIRGTYYSDLIRDIEVAGRSTSLPPDFNFPVNVATDLGFTDSTSLWFWQVRPGGLAIIDYEENHGKDLQFYFNLLREKKYTYDTIWLPHDAKAKSLQTGKSTVEQFVAEDFPVRIAPKLDVQDGVNAVRKTLKSCWFDKVATYDGFEGLRSYRRSYDEIKKVYTNTPVHDWASHPADAFRYLSLVAKPGLGTVESAYAPPPGYTTYNLEDLYADREQKQFNTLRI